MIKQSIFEEEIVNNMNDLLKGEEVKPSLNNAIDYLSSAAELFDDVGMSSSADEVLKILTKLAAEDKATKGLTSEKMVSNLLDHGTEFNLADDMSDVLDADVESDFESGDSSEDTFEDD